MNDQLILATFLRCEHLHVKLRCSPGKDMEGAKGIYLISFTTLRIFFSMHRHRFFALLPSIVVKTPNGTEWTLKNEGSIVQSSLTGSVVSMVVNSSVFEIEVVVSSSLEISVAVWVIVSDSSNNSVTTVLETVVVVASWGPNWIALK